MKKTIQLLQINQQGLTVTGSTSFYQNNRLPYGVWSFQIPGFSNLTTLYNCIPAKVSRLRNLLLVFSILVNCVNQSFSQATVSGKVNSAISKVNSANSTVANTASTVNNTIQTANTARKTITDIFGGSKNEKNTIIEISPIQFDDENLTYFKKAIEDCPKVKEVSVSYASGTATFEINYKNKSSKLWEDITPDFRRQFVLVEISGNKIILNYKPGDSFMKVNTPTKSEIIQSEVKAGKTKVKSAGKTTEQVDFLEFKIDGKLYHIDANDPYWRSMYAQLDAKNEEPNYYKAMGMKTGFTGGGSFVLALMKINNSIKTTKYSIKTGDRKGADIILGFEFHNSDQTAFSIDQTETAPNYVSDGFLEITRFENTEGGVSEGTFEFSNVTMKSFNNKIISSGHSLTEGKFRFTVHKLLPVY